MGTYMRAGDRLERAARAFAIDAHQGQVRKYTGEPYWHHCQEVAEIVKGVGGDAAQVAAAWLHDVLEDTQVTKSAIFDTFGTDVLTLVHYLSSFPKYPGMTRKERARLTLERLATAPPRAATIKLADIISNIESLPARDPAFAKVYMAEKEAQLRVLEGGDPTLRARAAAILKDWRTGCPSTEGA